MKEEFISLATADGPMDVFVVHPDGNGPHPGLVVIMEAFGVNHHIQNVCRHFAQEGFVVVSPELYHRSGARIELSYTDMKPVMATMATLTNDGVTTDVKAALNHVRQEKHVDSRRVGIVGYCVGGFTAFLGACRTDVAATVAYYGGGIVSAREGLGLQPLLPEAGNIQRPVLMFFGAQDQSISQEDVAKIDDTLTQLGKAHEIKVYDDAGHGFNCDERSSYRPDDSADAWRRTIAFFNANMS